MSENSDIVLTLVRMASDRPKFRLGDSAVHKMLYFFNQKCGKFMFKWSNLGPYSGEVHQILCDLQAAPCSRENRCTLRRYKGAHESVDTATKNILSHVAPSYYVYDQPAISHTV